MTPLEKDTHDAIEAYAKSVENVIDPIEYDRLTEAFWQNMYNLWKAAGHPITKPRPRPV